MLREIHRHWPPMYGSAYTYPLYITCQHGVIAYSVFREQDMVAGKNRLELYSARILAIKAIWTQIR